MPNSYFQFKEFRVDQSLSGMKVTTDACLFGAWIADHLNKKGQPFRLLDIGTGTGLLTLMVAQKNQNAFITSVEINQDAFQEAVGNFDQSKWDDRIACRHSSIQEFEDSRFDFIISNPPFFKGNQLGRNENKNQAIHSNLLSITQLLEATDRLLTPAGTCYFLYPEREMTQFIDLAKSKGLFLSKLIEIRNQARLPIFRQIGVFTRHRTECVNQQLNIREANGRYTKDFWTLLKDYYLEYNNPEFKS